MTYDPAEKRLRERSVDDIQQIEDRLAGIQEEFRKIRQEMQEKGITRAKMMLGTVGMLLDRLTPLATKCHGQMRTELTKLEVARLRERKREEQKAKGKKGI